MSKCDFRPTHLRVSRAKLPQIAYIVFVNINSVFIFNSQQQVGPQRATCNKRKSQSQRDWYPLNKEWNQPKNKRLGVFTAMKRSSSTDVKTIKKSGQVNQKWIEWAQQSIRFQLFHFMRINPTIKMTSPHLDSTTPGYKKKTQIPFNKVFLSWSPNCKNSLPPRLTVINVGDFVRAVLVLFIWMSGSFDRIPVRLAVDDRHRSTPVIAVWSP